MEVPSSSSHTQRSIPHPGRIKCPLCPCAFTSSKYHHLHNVYQHRVKKSVQPVIKCPLCTCTCSLASSKFHHLHNIYQHRVQQKKKKMQVKQEPEKGTLGKSNLTISSETVTGNEAFILKAIKTAGSGSTAVVVPGIKITDAQSKERKKENEKVNEPSLYTNSRNTCEHCGIQFDSKTLLFSHLIKRHKEKLERINLNEIDRAVLLTMPIRFMFD